MKHLNLKNLCMILLGNTIYALAIVMFILPNNMITGGTTGLGIAIHHYFGLPIHSFVLLFNTLMFLLGAAVLGMKFALTTLVSTFYYPVILGVLEQMPALQNVTDDKMLSTICGGLMIGMGIGVVIRCGASTGGMDIPPLVLNKKFGLPVSVMLYAFDFVILISQMLFTNKEEIVYGILLVLIYTVILDKVLLMGSTRTKVEIMTEKYEELNRLIQEQLDRGTTLVYTQTGYLKNDQPMILTVVSNRELMRLNQLVQETDPHAFMIIGNVNEVRGRGFSQQKVYKKEQEER
ncbi:YitT family protein [Dorea amylophila]|nr:YitT family protein [Dorea amylophila]MCU6742247.1 YitT family protein [Dorea amylophila]